MAGDFRGLMQTAMGKATGNVSLRLWTPQGASVAFVRQVAPTIEELTGRAVQVDARTADYPTATWGSESRDYHVCIDVPAREVGDEMLAGRVSLVEGDECADRRSSRRSGPKTSSCRRRSTVRSRITRARPSWPSASRRDSRLARRAISRPRRSSSDGPSSSPPRAATTGR